MARFLIIGSMAWDRPLWLSGPMEPGARVFAVSPDADGDLPAGRLGGGAANAACALANAGHEAAVYSAVADGRSGQLAMDAAAQAGCDLRFVSRVPGWGGETLLLIDPAGERIVMGYKVGGEIDRRVWKQVKASIAPPSPEAVAAFAPEGLYLRSALPGHRDLCARSAAVVAHWGGPGSETVDAHILIGSADDLGPMDAPYEAAAAVAAGRLEWAIVTCGADGGTAHGRDGTVIQFTTPEVEQRDATGAGDCFAAAILEARVAGAAMPAALDHAARWGAITASREGSAVTAAPRIYPPFHG